MYRDPGFEQWAHHTLLWVISVNRVNTTVLHCIKRTPGGRRDQASEPVWIRQDCVRGVRRQA